MAKFASLFPWLRDLFPPSQGVGFQPTEVSEDVSLIHAVYQGTERLGAALSQSITGGGAVTSVQTPAVGSGFYWYVLACGCWHDDTTARNMWLSMQGTSSWALAEAGRAMPINVQLPSPRAFIVPSHQTVQAEVDGLAAGKILRLRVLYFNIPLGQPAIPSP